MESESWQLAIEHYRAGDLVKAEAYCLASLRIDPQHADMLHLMGIVAFHSGHDAAAEAWLKQAVVVNPENGELQHNLGMVQAKLGNLEAAASSFQKAIAHSPEFVEAHNNLGNVLTRLGQHELAIESYEHALHLSPQRAEIHYNLANARVESGNFEAAIQTYRQALQFDPRLVDAQVALAKLLHQLGYWDESVAAYHQALLIQPDYPEVLNDLGNVLQIQGRLTEAAATYRRAIALRPEFAEAHRNLGNTYDAQGDYESAIACYERAANVQPGFGLATLVHQLQHRCRWERLEEWSQQVIESVDSDDHDLNNGVPNVIMPFCFLSLPAPTTPAQQLRCAQKYLKLLGLESPRFRPLHTASQRSAERETIRLGYLSADFRDHPVAYLIAELIESHNRDQFQVFGYTIGPDDKSPLRKRLATAFDRFRDLKSCADIDAAKQIAADEIDILVDLQGYTQHARTKILAMRPAPIQVNYLGYPGTMGATFIDYILVDDYIVPSDQQAFYTERLIHLPGCYMVNDHLRPIDVRTPQRTELGLPESALVFCAFTSSYKLTAELFDVWLNILREIPNSVLWLREGHTEVSRNLIRQASLRGVVPERLIFAPTVSMPEHLARHRVADLFLDTFPYNQHSTASDALRVGLPVLTCSGESFASRVAGSLLRSLGLTELITTTIAEYQAAAIHLARRPQRLASLRQRLAANLQSTTLWDGRVFAMNVEQAYRQMWANLNATS